MNVTHTVGRHTDRAVHIFRQDLFYNVSIQERLDGGDGGGEALGPDCG